MKLAQIQIEHFPETEEHREGYVITRGPEDTESVYPDTIRRILDSLQESLKDEDYHHADGYEIHRDGTTIFWRNRFSYLTPLELDRDDVQKIINYIEETL